MIYSFLQSGDSAVTVQFKNEISKEINSGVTSLCRAIDSSDIKGVVCTVGAFASLTVYYDCTIISAKKLKKKLEQMIKKLSAKGGAQSLLYEIPVCYDDEFSPDMQNVADHTGLSREEIIRLHSSTDYLIYMLGFLPGFAYLGGMDERLVTPRLESPRVEIFEGAVGIGGAQTGIYPTASPGGWQLIGRTPIKVYDRSKEKPILYKAGDYIRFIPIGREEYEKIKEEVSLGKYTVKTEEVRQ